MQKEYLDIILKDADNISAAFIIEQNLNKVKLQILKEKFVPLMTNLGKKMGFNSDISPERFFKSPCGFSFKKPEWKKFEVNFEFQVAKDLRDLIYGFKGTDISQDLDKYLRGLNYKSTEPWPVFQSMDYYRDWNKEFFLELYSLELYSNECNIIMDVFEKKISEISLLVENEEPRSKLLGIKDFTLKSLPLWGNKSPTPPVTAASCGVLNPLVGANNRVCLSPFFVVKAEVESCFGYATAERL